MTKTVYEVLVAAGPLLEDKWNSHNEITDGAARAGVTCGETLSGMDIDPILAMQIGDAILTQSGGKFPTTFDGLKDFWKKLIASRRP